MKKLFNIELSDEEFDRLMCEQASGKILKCVNGQVIAENCVITDKEIKENKIQELKQQLADWEYKTSKYLDGEYTEEEWQEIVNQRKQWREEIRELEKELEK